MGSQGQGREAVSLRKPLSELTEKTLENEWLQERGEQADGACRVGVGDSGRGEGKEQKLREQSRGYRERPACGHQASERRAAVQILSRFQALSIHCLAFSQQEIQSPACLPFCHLTDGRIQKATNKKNLFLLLVGSCIQM